MSKKISYGTKAPFQDKPEIPVENKVIADDMNEIKEAVNGNADELDTAKQNIENLQGGQGTASADITNLKNRVTILEGDNKTNKTNISNLQNNKVDKVNGKGLSTEDFTTELKTKLENLENYDDTEITEAIQNFNKRIMRNSTNIETLQDNVAELQESQEQQDTDIEAIKAENERLREDLKALPSGQAEGEYITLQDSADSRFNMFRVGGNSKQDTRSGKNKFNKSATPIFISDNITTEETSTGLTLECKSDSTLVFNLYKLLDVSKYVGKTARMSAIITLLTENEKGRYILGFCNSDGSTRIAKTTSNDSGNVLLLEIKENDIVDTPYLAVWLYARASGTLGKGEITYNDIIVTIDDEDMIYEAYGATPSEEFPSEIENVENNANIVVCNKNLANPEEVWENMHAHKASSCSQVIEDGRDCILFANSQFRGDVNNPFNLIDFKYKEKVSYTIRGMVKAYNIPESGSGSLSFQFNYSDGTISTYFLHADAASDFTELRLVSDPSKTVVRVGFTYGSSNQWYIDKSSIFIAEGDTTDYVTHQGKTFKFPLSQGQKLYKGDYLAEDGIHHVRKQIELDGTENFTDYKNYPDSYAYRFNLSGVKANTNILCTKYKCIPFSDFYNEETDVVGKVTTHNSSDNLIYFGSSKATVEEFKEEIKGNILEYEMIEEEIEAYTPEQQKAYDEIVQTAKSYKNVTNIFSTDTVSPIAYVNYRKDIESMLEQVQAQTNEIKELLSTTKTSAILLDNLQSDLESEVM